MNHAIGITGSTPADIGQMPTVAALLARNAAQRGDQTAVSWSADDAVRSLTWLQYHREVLHIASALMVLGVEQSDTVATLATNRVEHLIADLAASHCGAASTSLYCTLADAQLEHVLRDAAPRVVLVENAAAACRIAALSLPARPPRIVVIEPQPSRGEHFMEWAELREIGALSWDTNKSRIAQVSGSVDADDPLVYVYTSGTTGTSKGVILTHRNVADELAALLKTGSFDFDYRSVSYLPLAHLAERLWTLYVPVYLGGHVWCCPHTDELLDSLHRHRPTFFLAVPRSWQKLRAAAESVLASTDSEEIRSARTLLVQQWHKRCADQPIPAELAAGGAAAHETMRGVRAALGLERAELASSSSAPIAPELLQFFASVGITIYQGYGLTETAGVTFAQRPGRGGLPDVGTVLEGCEARIASDGEIMVRSTCNSPGYRNRPEDSARLYDHDCWMHTGDIGRIDDQGRLFVTGRKKDLIITAAGKNIAPVLIEDMLSGQSFIDRAVVIGDKRPYLIALVFVDQRALAVYASDLDIAVDDLDRFVTQPEIRSHVNDLIRTANTRLSRPEQIKQFVLINDALTVQSGALTPTLKLRRHVVEETYGDLIETLYAQLHSPSPKEIS